MKVINVFILALALIVSGCASTSPVLQDSYNADLSISKTSKSEAYERALEWFAINYGAGALIKYENAERGRMIARGYFVHEYSAIFQDSVRKKMYYPMLLDVSDERVRLRLTPSDSIKEYKTPGLQNSAHEHFKEYIKSFFDYVSTGGKFSSDKEWK